MGIGAVHWNNHVMCAIDVETTGFCTDKHEIIQIAVVPMNADLRINTKVLPFEMLIAPWKKQEDWEPGALRTHKIDMLKLCATGLDPWKVGDLFDEWFQRLNLPLGKKIIPLAHNYPFECRFLHSWLGPASMDSFFYQYRDTMALALQMNDIAEFHNEPYPFPRTSLGSVCRTLGVENTKSHDALADAIATAECYRRMMTKFKKI